MARGSIRKRSKLKDSNSWTLIYDLPPDPETGKRRQRSVTFHGTKKEAEVELRRLLAEVDQGIAGSAGKMTVEDYLTRWLADHVKPNLAPRTWMAHRSAIQHYILPHIGQIRLEKLRPTDVVALMARIREGGRADGKPGALSSLMLRNIHATLHTAMETAVKWRLIAVNPVATIAPPKAEPSEMRALQPEEARRFLGACSEETVAWQAFFQVALTTGMRLGELRALRWADLDMQKRTLSIVQTAQRIPGESVITRTPKTRGSRRKVTLSEEVVVLLRMHRKAQNEERLLRGADWKDLDLVFAGHLGNFLNEIPIRTAFHRILERAGLPRIRLHDLRHTAATLLLSAGVNPKVVAERLGHSNVRITLQTYSHVSETMQEQAAQTLETILRSTHG